MLALLDQKELFIADEVQAVVAHRAADSLKAIAKAKEGVKVSFDVQDARR